MTHHTQMEGRELAPCLVLNTRTGEWRVERRPPLAPRIDPRFDWSSELASAAKHYREKGERRDRA